MDSADKMYVTKRTGQLEEIAFDKIQNRIKKLGQEPEPLMHINYQQLVMKIIDQLYSKIPTTKIDELVAEQCASMSTLNNDYGVLAGRIVISNHQKNTDTSFSKVMNELFYFTDVHNQHNPLVSKEFHEFVQANATALDSMVDYSRDYLIDYFGFKTLERSYLYRKDKKVIERPQHMWLRVAVGLHGTSTSTNALSLIKETYDLMSRKYFTHATPTLFNAGTPRPQLSSCYLIAMESDSLDGIYNTLHDCAMISKFAGGIGLHVHNIRAKGTHIQGTNGVSNGLVPMLRVFNNTARYVDQCLHENTIVYTKRGPLQIRQAIVGDEIIADDGNLYPIRKVMEYYSKEQILEITLATTQSRLIATGMHPVWCIDKHDVETWLNSDTNVRCVIEPKFVEMQELGKGDYIGYPIPKYEKDSIHFDEEDCWMYGVLLGANIVQFDNNRVFISFLYATSQCIANVKSYLEKLHIQSDAYPNPNWLNFDKGGPNGYAFKFTKEMLFKSDEKYIMHFMLHLPINKINKILQGILDVNSNQLTIQVLSGQLFDSVAYLCLRLKSLLGLNIDGHITITKENTFEHNDCLFVQVESNEILSNNGEQQLRVFDLEVDDDEHHNFLTQGGLVHNGGGKRNGSFAIYLEPWHADIEDFLEMKKNHGDEEMKARDLFYALWVSDLFMDRVRQKSHWSLMCPHECPGLSDAYGDAFVDLYEMYEREGKVKKTVSARDLWFKILDAQMETGTPYLLYKDAVNKKSNQKNVGTIKSSNLCVAPETLVLTDRGHIEIQSLINQTVQVWNGTEFSEVVIRKTGTNQELIDVYTDDGCKLSCTKYHKFFIQSNQEQESTVVEAQNLKPNDKLVKCDYPVIDGPNTGMLLFKYKQPMESDLAQYSLHSKLTWFSYFCSLHYCVRDLCDNIAIRAEDVNSYHNSYEFLLEVKLMLQTCGINPIITPNNIFVITAFDFSKLISLGFKHPLADTHPHINNGPEYVSIAKIEDNHRIDDTYCFTEPKKHMGIFNGMLTSQCTEIMEYSDENETAVCNLASIALPAFVDEHARNFDFVKLHYVTKVVTNNLNRIIDINYYPTEKTKTSNMRHRPIGIGVQGLADAFVLLDIPYHSEEAKLLNKQIFETMYHAAVECSCELARQEGPYSTFAGSPASEGQLQFDLWGVSVSNERYDWDQLKSDVVKYGLRNSLLLAPMPTASTSQILGYNECFEPFTSNLYSRKTLAGEFVVVNKYLMKELIELGYWNEQIKNNIVENKGSIQQLTFLPQHVRDKYKIVWEIPMKHVIDMSADRGPFICQSQSLNLWMEDPVYNKLTSMHFYAWEKGLKTGIYYLRRKAKHQAQQFTIEPSKVTKPSNLSQSQQEGVCEMCSA